MTTFLIFLTIAILATAGLLINQSRQRAHWRNMAKHQAERHRQGKPVDTESFQ